VLARRPQAAFSRQPPSWSSTQACITRSETSSLAVSGLRDKGASVAKGGEDAEGESEQVCRVQRTHLPTLRQERRADQPTSGHGAGLPATARRGSRLGDEDAPRSQARRTGRGGSPWTVLRAAIAARPAGDSAPTGVAALARLRLAGERRRREETAVRMTRRPRNRYHPQEDGGAPRGCAPTPKPSDHRLERLERRTRIHVPRRLRLEDRRLLGEGVDPLASLVAGFRSP